jgi:hypothetical protein
VKGKLLWSIFLALVAVFLLVFIAGFIPIHAPPSSLFLVRVLSFIVPCALLLLLGVTLIVLTVERVGGMLRVFLLLTGASAAGMVVSIVLHNVMDMVGIEEPLSFIMAVYVCPIAFLVGAIGSVVLGFKKSPPRRR